MEAKEFRLGNILKNITNGKIIKVEAITNELISVSGIEHNRYTPLNFENVKGIEINHNNLIYLGFIHDEEKQFYTKDYVCIGFLTDDTFYQFEFDSGVDYKVIDVKYVHQLQNLYFSLTGEELKFFKKCNKPENHKCVKLYGGCCENLDCEYWTNYLSE